MKISRIHSYELRVPLGAQAFWSSQCRFDHRKSLVVRLETDDGFSGWGEGGQYGPSEPVAAALHSVLAPLVLGEDPRRVEALWERMYAATLDYGRKGSVVEAMSSLDIAMWDISGKSHGAPVYQLWGAGFRDRVSTYATGLYYRGETPPTLDDDLPGLVKEAEEYAAAGFPAVKMKVGLLLPEEDLERVAAVRRAIGPDRPLMVDSNHAYAAHVAIRMAKRMESHDVFWFEEPVGPDDIDGYRHLKAATSLALAGGECEYTRFGFRKWINGGVLDIVQPDVCCAGGLGEVRRIAAMASACHVRCFPHVWGSGVAIAAGLQLLASLPPSPATALPIAPYSEPMLEWDANPNPLRTKLLKFPLEPIGGQVLIPSGPGLGIEINERVLQEYLTAHTTTDESGTYIERETPVLSTLYGNGPRE